MHSSSIYNQASQSTGVSSWHYQSQYNVVPTDRNISQCRCGSFPLQDHDFNCVLQMTMTMDMATTTTMDTAVATMQMSTATSTTMGDQQQRRQLHLVTLQQQLLQLLQAN